MPTKLGSPISLHYPYCWLEVWENLIDRILNHGRVVDFLILETNSFHTGILNVADLVIILSIVMLVILEILRKRAT
jgi:lipoprotein signal peptidase